MTSSVYYSHRDRYEELLLKEAKNLLRDGSASQDDTKEFLGYVAKLASIGISEQCWDVIAELISRGINLNTNQESASGRANQSERFVFAPERAEKIISFVSQMGHYDETRRRALMMTLRPKIRSHLNCFLHILTNRCFLDLTTGEDNIPKIIDCISNLAQFGMINEDNWNAIAQVLAKVKNTASNSIPYYAYAKMIGRFTERLSEGNPYYGTEELLWTMLKEKISDYLFREAARRVLSGKSPTSAQDLNTAIGSFGSVIQSVNKKENLDLIARVVATAATRNLRAEEFVDLTLGRIGEVVRRYDTRGFFHGRIDQLLSDLMKRIYDEMQRLQREKRPLQLDQASGMPPAKRLLYSVDRPNTSSWSYSSVTPMETQVPLTLPIAGAAKRSLQFADMPQTKRILYDDQPSTSSHSGVPLGSLHKVVSQSSAEETHQMNSFKYINVIYY